MTTVRIYQPSKTAMQSGKGKTKRWSVEFQSDDPLITGPLIGWVGSYDMTQELRLFFPSLNDALQFAKKNGFSYRIYNSAQTVRNPKNYATNFTCPRVRGS